MSEIKITAMGAATTPLVGTELLTAVQSGANVKVAASDVAAAFATDAANILPVANGGTGAVTLTGYVKGSGTSALTAAATIPFADLAGRAYASYYSGVDQTGDVAVGKAVLFPSTFVAGSGVSVATNGSGDPTRVTFAAAGTYAICTMAHFSNSDTSDHNATQWLRLNGTDVVATTQVTVIPKTGDGGSAFAHLVFYITVTAAQYVEMMWLPENAAVTLNAVNAVTGPPAYPSQPSATIQIERIA
jgi:hypothetical protein